MTTNYLLPISPERLQTLAAAIEQYSEYLAEIIEGSKLAPVMDRVPAELRDLWRKRSDDCRAILKDLESADLDFIFAGLAAKEQAEKDAAAPVATTAAAQPRKPRRAKQSDGNNFT